MTTKKIDLMATANGRMLGEDDSIINVADEIKGINTKLGAGSNLGGEPISETNPLPVTSAEQSTAVATIAANDTKSNVIDKRGKVMTVIELDGWTTADITFLGCSTPDGTFRPVYDDYGNEATAIVSPDISVSLARLALVLAPVNYIKIRSGHAASEVAQAAERTLTLSLSR